MQIRFLAAVLALVPFVPSALAQSPASPATAGAAAPTPKVIFDKASAYGRVFVVAGGLVDRDRTFDDLRVASILAAVAELAPAPT